MRARPPAKVAGKNRRIAALEREKVCATPRRDARTVARRGGEMRVRFVRGGGEMRVRFVRGGGEMRVRFVRGGGEMRVRFVRGGGEMRVRFVRGGGEMRVRFVRGRRAAGRRARGARADADAPLRGQADSLRALEAVENKMTKAHAPPAPWKGPLRDSTVACCFVFCVDGLPRERVTGRPPPPPPYCCPYPSPYRTLCSGASDRAAAVGAGAGGDDAGDGRAGGGERGADDRAVGAARAAAGAPPPPLVLSGHAASITPY